MRCRWLVVLVPSVILGQGCHVALTRDLPPSGTQAVYLSWQRDPTTTMTVHWLTRPEHGSDALTWTPRGEESWQRALGAHRPVPHSDHLLHTVELTELTPGGDYRFRIAGDRRDYAFRTMPADAGEPITFVVGGDLYREGFDQRMYVQAARRDPMFALIGGDIVYDNGEPARVSRWFHWLNAWEEFMVTSDGRLIPMIVTIGNHEVRGEYDRTPAEAPFFYSWFAWPGEQGCGVLDFGGYMSIVALDSGHTHPIGGAQTEWLQRTLADRSDVDHVFAVYHVPAYPSVRAFDGGKSPLIRQHWVPLFDRWSVDVVYENHDHAYKRTPLIRGGQVDRGGILYLGDGAWGVAPRNVHDPRTTWYLERAESVKHVIVTTIHGRTRRHEAVNELGEVFDSYPETRGGTVERAKRVRPWAGVAPRATKLRSVDRATQTQSAIRRTPVTTAPGRPSSSTARNPAGP